ncbi:oligoendopeptidase [Thalassobacillus devorans]|uniref:Oligoendopeptidase n=1 Tax=Thalassobacillus devorans TaxID=279813 RepID=A0ABQ1PRE2_9BACI|nr:M3 family oligoendopeptidase [Thalassobacillus devorans]NIK30609.1 pepF/M3 family oligoendopeptidase [Thalassobacillus devorans]GGD01576.1 oligoendopeptidase [Thalassobacillus devorans]
MNTYNLRWNLDSLFPGESNSKEFESYVQKTEQFMLQLKDKVEDLSFANEEGDAVLLTGVLDVLQTVTKRIREIGAFVSCLTAQDVNDIKAKEWLAKRSQLGADYSNILTKLDEKLMEVGDQHWEGLLQEDSFSPVSFVLEERRKRAKEKLPADQESLINDLSVDGYHAWGQLYNSIVGKMAISVEGKELSVGQASNKLSSSNRKVRKEAAGKLQEAWEEKSDLFTETLNHLAGFRLQTYKHRGWNNTLKEPLDINRMNKKTLHAMWNAITKYKKYYTKYLSRKADLLGLDKLAIYDVGAPIGGADQKLSYDEGAAFIIEQFGKFSPKMAEFAEMAFDKRWIEAEDRPGKRPGGFCTSFPDSKETRIFMTYSGTPSNVATLAHELGHAYHQHVMNDLPILNQGYAMNVAETASTFAEMIVADAAVKHAENGAEKAVLLEDKVQRSVAFFMNIHARFLFETRFYEERKQGMVPTARLNELMVDAQREAYQEALGEYDPYFWASKLHFHITGVPFYNFPYTFGYLFSLGIYAQSLKEGNEFENKYISLLQDTGKMRVEDLAEKHLGVNLEQQEFWEDAMKVCIKDVEEFLKLTAGTTAE